MTDHHDHEHAPAQPRWTKPKHDPKLPVRGTPQQEISAKHERVPTHRLALGAHATLTVMPGRLPERTAARARQQQSPGRYRGRLVDHTRVHVDPTEIGPGPRALEPGEVNADGGAPADPGPHTS